MPSYNYIKLATFSAVSDADGDIVRCRWAESSQNECSDVCQVFPATLDQVSYVCDCEYWHTQVSIPSMMQVGFSLLACQIVRWH